MPLRNSIFSKSSHFTQPALACGILAFLAPPCASFGSQSSPISNQTKPSFILSQVGASDKTLSISCISYGVGAVLIFALVCLYHRRQKARLEELVSKRTQALHKTNTLLEEQIRQTLQKADELAKSEELHRKLSGELEQRIQERTLEHQQRITQVEILNKELQQSQRAADRAAARIQETNAELLSANHELESFSYSVSHDLRAPLRNITGFIELLEKRLHGKADSETTRYIETVVSETKRMGSLIDDLLTFSRLGRTELNIQSVQLNEIIDQVKLEFAHDTQGRTIEWQIQSLPPVQGDPVLLRQVMANLIGNALKFTRSRTPAIIEIAMVPGSDNSKLITLFVRDNGVGFNPQYIDKLFRVFQRLHPSRDFEGTGIGLANVKRIINRHGGRSWAEGKVDNGATFYFTLKPSKKDP